MNHLGAFAAGFLVVAVSGLLELGEAETIQILRTEHGLPVSNCGERGNHAMARSFTLGAFFQRRVVHALQRFKPFGAVAVVRAVMFVFVDGHGGSR